MEAADIPRDAVTASSRKGSGGSTAVRCVARLAGPRSVAPGCCSVDADSKARSSDAPGRGASGSGPLSLSRALKIRLVSSGLGSHADA